jgi:inner membrane protein
MEPITHFLTGACIGRAGLNHKTAYATLVAVLAAEAADVDVLWGLRGPVEELKHHRGITHTFIAVPVVAAAAVGAVWLLDRWREGRRLRKAARDAEKEAMAGVFPEKHPSGAKARFDLAAADAGAEAPAYQPAPFIRKPILFIGWSHSATSPAARPAQEVHWGWLYLTALIAALSHLALDWTNNYGLRPFFPFNPRWYAGSFVFIAEPVLWAFPLVALIVPWLLGLADAEIGVRRAAFRGRGWAIFALAGMVALWCWRWAEHAQALAMVENVQIATAPIRRVAMEPYPVNPFRWHAIVETDDFYQTAEIDTRTGTMVSDAHRDVLFKPPVTAATEAAKRTPLGQVYMDWGSWAVVRDVGQEPVAAMAAPQLPPNRQWTTVEFTDLRFAYSYLGYGGVIRNSPLAGWVYIVDGRDDAGEAMGGREQH